ncbi:XrtA system polysaccharide deacetylase [Aeoliella mucimassa]|uniref:Peptidoglycan-N-acetylglucosamine deacetylase n=1 Tax=Aeoliella mucimassa TaxID=2527972 RepID=A0A518ALR0_9BACT|nr:XrtA system polysaccharide deacetylase [Aeoliella mucimassa]QDU55672.1 Peptidoglycan-N-acetylglucosamine deacetylase [Aeoliella mucimassa]
MQHALTIDVEDYFQVSNFEPYIPKTDWDNYPLRVEKSTERVLEILASKSITATFYIVGYIAERCPALVRRISDQGHQVASHSYWHRRVSSLTRQEFRDDLRRSRQVLEDTIGMKVTAFRAPSFSITHDMPWALDVLVEEGIDSDSSLTAASLNKLTQQGDVYGPCTMELISGLLDEFPIAVQQLGNVSMPICGGGYFRLFPLKLSVYLLTRWTERFRVPFTFYIHPWEFDPDQPRLRLGTAQQRFRHYVNLSRTEQKFTDLLSAFDFGRLDVVATQQCEPQASLAIS